jgi:hypothetical protein
MNQDTNIALKDIAEQFAMSKFASSQDRFNAMATHIVALREENERLKNTAKTCGAIIHNMTVANQAAWIEWQHGGGAESAMEWVENGLVGPGLIPEDDEPHNTNAQAYFDANISGPGGL